MKCKALVIAGPTGVGKTDISIEIAKKLNSDIISADSAQVYKGLDIGTAKISEDEKQGVKHHLIDIVEPIKKYSVGDFQKEVDSILNLKEENSENIMLVGGTGLYIDSVTEGLSDLPSANADLRATYSNFSNEELFEKLKNLDKESYLSIHKNNRVRIERALEVCELTGKKFSELSKNNIKNNNYTFHKIALERSRDNLYDRINKRVDIMVNDGLLEEVENLYRVYGEALKKLNILGYSQIIDYLDSEISLELSIEKLKQETRRYAKRQFTWFKHKSDYTWYNLDFIRKEEIVSEIINSLKKAL